jgi:ABC transporter DrrB family efflux protein
MRGYWSIVTKEFLHLRRDSATLLLALVIPVIQLTIFGFAVNFDIRHIRTVVVDLDRSRESRQYVQSLTNTQYIEVVSVAASPPEGELALRDGTARVVVIIPSGFSAMRSPGQTSEVQVLIDGSDSQVATRARLAFLARPAAPSPGSVEPRISMVYNPDMRTEAFMIPGLIGLILQLVTVSLTAFSLVREKEQGTLEQLMVSPVGRLGLMLGKLTPYAVLAMVEMCAVLLLGWLIFDVRVTGSVPLLLLLSIPFIVASLGLGLLISTVAQNQAQALQLTMLVLLPSILMSGFVFPRETIPGPLYIVSMAIPLTYFLDILRGIYLRGAGFLDLLPAVLALIAIGTVLITVATTRFRKSIS